MSTTTQTQGSISELTDAQRKALATKVIKARESGQPWDGENGIVNDSRFPLVKSAQVGRKLVREGGKAEIIQRSYDRAAKGLVGPRTKDAPKAAKVAAKPAAKRTRKAK